MAQNIYDDAGFFDAYASLPRSKAGLAAAPEWPYLEAMLPPLAGRRVLDLGCGYGWFTRYAAEQGADTVGLDVSERMLEVARAAQPSNIGDGTVTYERVDLDRLDAAWAAAKLGSRAFDVVYSSLTFHYVVDFDRLMEAVGDIVTADATIVCSVEHPVATAPHHPAAGASADGRPVWALEGYFDEGERVTDWLAPGVVKQHRTIESYARGLRAGGFAVSDLIEWHPSPSDLASNPSWAEFNEYPSFLLLRGDRDQ